jgi:LmbE family N-acetylglucosaminyl deacetylase
MNEFEPKIVLVVAAHADDNEFCFGGSVAKWASEGAEVHYLVVTDGRRGTPSADDNQAELIATRVSEQKAAADILGVKSVTCLSYEDGRMELTWDLKKDIVRVIRQIKPDTVLCMDPTFAYSVEQNYINHNDHRVVGQATLDAVYPLARDETAFDDLRDIEPHKVNNLLMHNPNNEHMFIDVTDHMDTKVAAARAHASQFGDGDYVEKAIRDFAAKCAEKSQDCQCAEGFVALTLR